MATTVEKIAEEAAELTRLERLTLVRLLLDLNQPSTGNESEYSWENEIRARVQALNVDRVSGVPYEQLKKEMSNRFNRWP